MKGNTSTQRAGLETNVSPLQGNVVTAAVGEVVMLQSFDIKGSSSPLTRTIGKHHFSPTKEHQPNIGGT